jgi:hypothetical protein
MNHLILKLLVAAVTAALVLGSMTADAQVPPHNPGTVCATPTFWCWAPRPGPPGAQCACPTPYGWVPGVLL